MLGGVAATSALVVADAARANMLTDLLGKFVSPEQEKQLGEQAFAQLKRQVPVSRNTALQSRLRGVGERIVPASGATIPVNQWEFVVFKSNEINAFALPGGKVGVNTGIFKVARNQDQLATVIAHEIGHVVSRHHEERLTRQAGTQGVLELVGALLGSRYGQGAADAAVQGGSVLAQTGFLLPGSRAQESEADVVGQQLMAKAGFDPRQAVNLWQNMIAAGGSRSPAWLSTHPDPQSRLGELSARSAGLMPVYEQARASGRRPTCG
jgi:predicted Zn-dependent protease